jgi:hypothetical protein
MSSARATEAQAVAPTAADGRPPKSPSSRTEFSARTRLSDRVAFDYEAPIERDRRAATELAKTAARVCATAQSAVFEILTEEIGRRGVPT